MGAGLSALLFARWVFVLPAVQRRQRDSIDIGVGLDGGDESCREMSKYTVQSQRQFQSFGMHAAIADGSSLASQDSASDQCKSCVASVKLPLSRNAYSQHFADSSERTLSSRDFAGRHRRGESRRFTVTIRDVRVVVFELLWSIAAQVDANTTSVRASGDRWTSVRKTIFSTAFASTRHIEKP
jgi:hypothetical protein